jgi:hypothetical protein
VKTSLHAVEALLLQKLQVQATRLAKLARPGEYLVCRSHRLRGAYTSNGMYLLLLSGIVTKPGATCPLFASAVDTTGQQTHIASLLAAGRSRAHACAGSHLSSDTMTDYVLVLRAYSIIFHPVACIQLNHRLCTALCADRRTHCPVPTNLVASRDILPATPSRCLNSIGKPFVASDLQDAPCGSWTRERHEKSVIRIAAQHCVEHNYQPGCAKTTQTSQTIGSFAN